MKSDNLEIGRILHLKSQIKNLKLDDPIGKDDGNTFIFPNLSQKGMLNITSRVLGPDGPL